MATQVPSENKALPAGMKPERASSSLETPSNYKEALKNRSAHTKYTDPCAEASKASLDCLERAHYNRNECMDYFRAYRECKKNWLEQIRKDKAGG